MGVFLKTRYCEKTTDRCSADKCAYDVEFVLYGMNYLLVLGIGGTCAARPPDKRDKCDYNNLSIAQK